MRTTGGLCALIAVVMLWSGAAWAQGASAKLTRVDDGIFELRQGQSVDLTDRKILLTFRLQQNPRYMEKDKRVIMVLNGSDSAISQGRRIDLKRQRHTAELLKDKGQCYLELIDLVMPRGAPSTASLRFHCT